MTTPSFNFEKSLQELEDITRWFESGEANLDQGLEKFERGMELAAQLKSHLATVENRVEKIKARFSAPPSANASSNGSPLSDPSSAAPISTPVPDDDQTGLFG